MGGWLTSSDSDLILSGQSSLGRLQLSLPLNGHHCNVVTYASLAFAYSRFKVLFSLLTSTSKSILIPRDLMLPMTRSGTASSCFFFFAFSFTLVLQPQCLLHISFGISGLSWVLHEPNKKRQKNLRPRIEGKYINPHNRQKP